MKRKPSASAATAVLPMALRVGDRFTDAEGHEWEVLTTPKAMHGAKKPPGSNRAAGRARDRARHDLGGPRAGRDPAAASAVTELPLSRLPYLLPHVRVQRLVHTILATRWDAATWPLVETQVPRVLELRDQVAREGWWN